MKHLLSIESLDASRIRDVVGLARELKRERGRHVQRPLADGCWGLIFSKSSTRTRISFEVGIRELGGSPMFLAAGDIQLGRGEPIRDTARVMGRMLRGAVIRTYLQSDVEEFAQFSGIPTINALTDDEHPCQILADLQTIEEERGGLDGLTVCFVGDGACNVARSWMWASHHLGFPLRIASPLPYQPEQEMVGRMPTVTVTDSLAEACAGADVLYTDVWVSMGKEDESAFRMAQLAGYQINTETIAMTGGAPMVMHCLPAYRGKEITDEVFEEYARLIFDQAENRLHTQKAVLSILSAG